uniref:Uncharacterized protein n=1 Tax=Apis cerana TaxID=7461 RepID=V9I8I2_APICE
MERGMESGAIDAEQCQVLDTATGQFYPIDVAFSRGLLIALDRPLARHPVYSAVGCGTRGEGEAERAEEEEEAEEKVSSLKKAIEDGLVDARTAVVRDPDSGRFVAVGDALEEGRILDPSWTGTFGRGEARLVRVGEADVYLAQPLGLEEVVGKGLMDGEGRVVDSRTRERVTLREAVRLGIVDPESAVIKDTRGEEIGTVGGGVQEGADGRREGERVGDGDVEAVRVAEGDRGRAVDHPEPRFLAHRRVTVRPLPRGYR